MRRRAAAFMMALITVTSLAGCGGGTSQDTPAADSTAESDSADGVESTENAAAPANSGESTELTFWLTNEGENYEKVFEEFNKRAGNDLGISIKLNWTTKHGEEMPLKLMNQEACDLAFDAYWLNLASNISNGLYADLTPYFNNDAYPGLKTAFTEDILETMKSADGAIYAIPFFEQYADMRCLFYREDWREQLGCEPVTSEETFLAYLKAVDENKDSLGVESAMGLKSRGYFYYLSDWYTAIANNIVEVDGTGITANLNFRALLSDDGKTVEDVSIFGDPDSKFANYPEGYQENFMTKRFLKIADEYGGLGNEDSATVNNSEEKFYVGKYGAIEGNLDGYNNIAENLAQNAPDAKLGVWFYETQIQNKEKTFTNQALSANYVAVPYYSGNIDKTMQFLDWVFQSQENHDLFCYGIEGEDWKASGDKAMENLTADNQYVFPGYELCWNPAYTRTNASWPQEMQDYKSYATNKDNFELNPISGFVFDPNVSAELKTAYAALKSTGGEYSAQLQSGLFGADTQNKIDEFYTRSENDIEIVREEVKKQLQEYLDGKN